MTSQTQDRDQSLEQNLEQSAEQSVETVVGDVVGNAVRIGRLWAVYGLEIGRAALRTSSETLRATSEILGSLAKAIDEEPPAASAPEREPASPEQAA